MSRMPTLDENEGLFSQAGDLFRHLTMTQRALNTSFHDEEDLFYLGIQIQREIAIAFQTDGTECCQHRHDLATPQQTSATTRTIAESQFSAYSKWTMTIPISVEQFLSMVGTAFRECHISDADVAKNNDGMVIIDFSADDLGQLRGIGHTICKRLEHMCGVGYLTGYRVHNEETENRGKSTRKRTSTMTEAVDGGGS